MDTDTLMERVPGGPAVIDWFGRVPQFHDAELLKIELSSIRNSTVLIHAWNMTEVVGSDGHYLTDRHAVVTINLAEVSAINLSDFHQTGIIFGLELTDLQSETQISWTSSYGVDGRIVAKEVSFELKPGRP